MQFTWSEPDGNFDPVTDYKVYWDQGLNLELFTILTESTLGATEWTKDNSQLPELVPGGYYQFKVSALNSIGESQMSTALVMIAATVPDAPTVPQFVESDRTSITLSWSVTYNGGAVVDDFEIDWK